MLNEICQYLRNFFDEDSKHNRLPYWEGEITVENGELVGFSDRLLVGQYFRIVDSALNDGVYQYPATTLRDEVFDGIVQSMKIPADVLMVAEEIGAWQAKYGGVDSNAMSPFSSESFFGRYSYQKSNSSESGLEGWKAVYGSRLAPWRKI